MAVGDDFRKAGKTAERLTAAGFPAMRGSAGYPAYGTGGEPPEWDNDTLVVIMGADVAARLAAELADLREERRGTVRLIIRGREGIVARVEDYRGPVPQAGQAVFHPSLGDDGTSDMSLHGNNVMNVKSVIIGMIGRPQNGEAHFTGRPVTVVEVLV